MPSSNCGWSAVEHDNASPGKLGDLSFSDMSSIGKVVAPALCTLDVSHDAGREVKPCDMFALVHDSEKHTVTVKIAMYLQEALLVACSSRRTCWPQPC